MKEFKIKILFRFFLLIIPVCTTFSSSAQALKVVVYNDPPFLYLDKNKQPAGIFVEILDYIAEKEDWEIDYRYYEVRDILEAIRKNEVDIIPDVINKSVVELYNGSEVVLVTWGQIYYTGKFKLNNVTDLEGKKIAVQAGDYIVESKEDGLNALLRRFNVNATILYFDTYEEVLEQINENEVDAGVLNKVFGKLHFREYGIKESEIIFSPISTVYAAPFSDKEKHTYINIIDDYLRRLKQDKNSIYYKVLNKYLIKPTETSLPDWFLTAALFSGILFLFLIGFGLFLRFQVKKRTALLFKTNLELKASKSKIEKINRKLSESSRKYSTLINNLQGVVFRAKFLRSWPMEFISDGVKDLTGFEPKKFMQNENFSWLSIVYHEDMEQVWYEIQTQLKKQNFYEIIYRIIDINGDIKWVNEKGEGIKVGSKQVVAVEGFINDITEIKRHEINLIKHKKNLEKNIAERTEEITSKNEELRESNKELFKINEKLVTEIAERKLAQERSIKLSDELQETNVQLEERQEEIMQQAEMLAVTNEELELKKTKLEDALSRLKNTQFKLIQSEKMASVGQLTAGIAHEINNPVNFINGGIDSLESILQDIIRIIKQYDRITVDNYTSKIKEINKLKEESNYLKLLEGVNKLTKNIKTGAVRTTQIVKSLRQFSRLDENDVKRVDIHENIESTLIMLQNKFKNRIIIHKQYGKIPRIECFPGKLNQVFMNLLVNAIDAIPDKGEIWIKTGTSEETEKGIPKFLYLSIKDSGIGMPKKVINRIFEPFFTTKDIGKGTGLGLSISYSIIEDHKGEIEVFSEEGKGTEFFITLPGRLNIKEDENAKQD